MAEFPSGAIFKEETGGYMNKTKVYDLPTRLFHWLFAGLFLGAFAIAKLVDDESALFSQHMLLGLLLTFLSVLRIAWGFLGSRHARFTSFPLHPKRLFTYFRDILSSRAGQYLAHNPASAWAALVMLGLALGLGATGYLMATGQKEVFEDAHELLANAFVFVAVAHVAGVALHQLRHRDGIAFSMLHGKKSDPEGTATPAASHRFAALALAGLMGVFAFHVYRNYDASRATTSVFGVTLQLGEMEESEHGHDDDHGGHDD